MESWDYPPPEECRREEPEGARCDSCPFHYLEGGGCKGIIINPPAETMGMTAAMRSYDKQISALGHPGA